MNDLRSPAFRAWFESLNGLELIGLVAIAVVVFAGLRFVASTIYEACELMRRVDRLEKMSRLDAASRLAELRPKSGEEIEF